MTAELTDDIPAQHRCARPFCCVGPYRREAALKAEYLTRDQAVEMAKPIARRSKEDT